MAPKKIRKLHEEVSILKEVDHPHIVRLREVYYGGDLQLHLVMDLCTGGELFDYLVKQPGEHVSESQGADILRQMLSAV
eukprot:12895137-Prorocentrum_lima.AAC.1